MKNVTQSIHLIFTCTKYVYRELFQIKMYIKREKVLK